MLMLLMHWFACFYYMISESEGFFVREGSFRNVVLMEHTLNMKFLQVLCEVGRILYRLTRRMDQNGLDLEESIYTRYIGLV